jgi:hypothetical protein
MAGNILGGRSWYSYTADSGQVFSIQMDDSIAASVGAVLDDTNPSPPKRLEPRVVHCEAVVTGGIIKRKSVVVPLISAAVYATDTTATITIDGLAFQTTGRTGEKLTFPVNRGAVDPGDVDVVA